MLKIAGLLLYILTLFAGSALAKFKRSVTPIRTVAVLRAGIDIVYLVRNPLFDWLHILAGANARLGTKCIL